MSEDVFPGWNIESGIFQLRDRFIDARWGGGSRGTWSGRAHRGVFCASRNVGTFSHGDVTASGYGGGGNPRGRVGWRVNEIFQGGLGNLSWKADSHLFKQMVKLLFWMMINPTRTSRKSWFLNQPIKKWWLDFQGKLSLNFSSPYKPCPKTSYTWGYGLWMVMGPYYMAKN